MSAAAIRVYLPATLGTLASAYLAGRFEAGRAGHAVTPAVREWYVEGDQDELEYAALSDAAQASLRLLAAEIGTQERYAHRRVVVSADVPPEAVTPVHDDSARSAVRLAVEISLAAVVSVHVDDPADAQARTAVAEAVAILAAADAGDADAQFALDEAESHELLWYDVTEIADLI